MWWGLKRGERTWYLSTGWRIVVCKGNWDKGIRREVKGTQPGMPEEFPEMISDLSQFLFCPVDIQIEHTHEFSVTIREMYTQTKQNKT